MPQWSTACPDWEERIVQGRSLISFEPLFPDEAAAALEVFRVLRVADVAGCPTMGEICREWITDYVAAIFGAYDAESGRRLISESLVLVAKKNFKSGLAAGIMMTALVKNWRESAEFTILSPTIEIANNSFFPARDMIRRSEELDDLMHLQEHYRTITNRKTGATLKVVAADSETVGGKKSTGILVDELWLFGKKAGAESMLLEATGGLASRPEGFVIYLSTQSDEAPAGVFKQKLDYARGVRDGRINDKRFLPLLYEFPERMVKAQEYREPKNFYITNPNLGASVDEEFLGRELTKAHESGEHSLRGFFAKHLNVEIGLALHSDRWAGADFWEQCAEPGLTLEALLDRCDVVVVGIDGGGLDDLLGLTATGRERVTGRWLTCSRAWVHKIVLERRKDIAPKLLDLAKTGDLVIVEHARKGVNDVADIVCMIRDRGLLPDEKAIGVDQAGIKDIYEELTSEARGIKPEQIIGIPQGFRLNGIIKTVERKLEGKEIAHGNSDLMNWCVGNAKIEQKGNAIVITKQASGTAKIDPVMSLLDTAELMALNPKPPGKKFQFFAVA